MFCINPWSVQKCANERVSIAHKTATSRTAAKSVCTFLHHTPKRAVSVCFVEVRSRTGHIQSATTITIHSLVACVRCWYCFDDCGTMRKSFMISCVLCFIWTVSEPHTHTKTLVSGCLSFASQLFLFLCEAFELRCIDPILHVYRGLILIVNVCDFCCWCCCCCFVFAFCFFRRPPSLLLLLLWWWSSFVFRIWVSSDRCASSFINLSTV